MIETWPIPKDFVESELQKSGSARHIAAPTRNRFRAL